MSPKQFNYRSNLVVDDNGVPVSVEHRLLNVMKINKSIFDIAMKEISSQGRSTEGVSIGVLDLICLLLDRIERDAKLMARAVFGIKVFGEDVHVAVAKALLYMNGCSAKILLREIHGSMNHDLIVDFDEENRLFNVKLQDKGMQG